MFVFLSKKSISSIKTLILIICVSITTYATADNFAEILKSAEQGNADAQYNLGLMYDFGRGVEEDDTQAVHWYRKAAEQNHAKAQYNLGVMYEYGEGVEEDHTQAVYWFKKAADQNYEGAQEALEKLQGK